MTNSITHSRVKISLTATFGTILEWAEFSFFAYMADQLSKQFFSIEDPTTALLKTYVIFATSYFMRPLGGIIFGSIGDKLGRKPALMSSMLLMGLATVAIGFLPNYSDVGRLATVLLLLCRLLQGLAVGGEFHGAITFLHEHSEFIENQNNKTINNHSKSHQKLFFIGSLPPFAAASGMALGALTASFTLLPNAPDYAWRIPFLLSGVLCLIALYLRSHLEETPLFKSAQQNKQLAKFPLVKVFKENKKGLLTSFCISIFIAIYVYIGNIFYKILCIKVGGMSLATAAQIVTFGQISAAICILICGKIADKWNGKKLCLLGLGTAIIVSPFILACAKTGVIYFALLGQCLYALINGMVSAPMMTLLMQQFKTETRYSGSAIGWNLGAAIFGGTALMVAESLISQFGFQNGPGLYMSLAAFIGFLALISINTSSSKMIPLRNPQTAAHT